MQRKEGCICKSLGRDVFIATYHMSIGLSFVIKGKRSKPPRSGFLGGQGYRVLCKSF